jgi:hypothetical protein
MTSTLFALAASASIALAAPTEAAAPVATEPAPATTATEEAPSLDLTDAQVAAIAAIAEAGQAEVDAALARGDAAAAERAGQRTMDAILQTLSAEQMDAARAARPSRAESRPLLRRERGLQLLPQKQ